MRIKQFFYSVVLGLCLPFSSAPADAEIALVLGYEGMARYASAVSSADSPDRGALADEHIYSAYFDRCSGEGNRRSMSRETLSTPAEDVSALSEVIKQIQQSDAIERIQDAANTANELLPIDELTICVFAVPPDSGMADFVVNTFNGVFGFVESPGVLWMQLLPTEGWLDEIYPGFAHEYYHAAAHPDNPMGTNEITLLDLLVNEGGADSFAAILYPDFVPSWTRAISLEQEIELWPRVQRALNTNDFAVIQDYLYGDGESIPDQAGYTIGFQIVQGYLAAHPDDPPIVWSRVDPKVVLDESGYTDRVALDQ
ncbi:MAG: DUF2268 domain-containing putative Zn-dependent protease [Pseudomonadota bacterium]